MTTIRKFLLDELKKHQLQPDELERLHSTSSMQTRGLRRFANDDELQQTHKVEQCLNPLQLVQRRKRRKLGPKVPVKESSSSDDTEDQSTDDDDDEPKPEETINETTAEKVHVKSPSLEACHEQSDVVAHTVFQSRDDDHKSACKPKQQKTCDNETEAIKPIKREPAIFVQVTRDPNVEKARLELPIIGEEQRIMEKIRYNDIVIVSGETGSGKTTQIPQFLYEAGYTLNGKMIGITEPRRVAAVAMSQRVAHELNLSPDEVAYQIRFAGNVSNKTQIKFMTDGVLLRECQEDFLLTKYSVLIIDEAHERSVFSDILIGLLSRIVPLRSKKGNPLKLIIMSATLRVSDFTENSFLFPKVPPVIKIEARQYPVTIRFAKTTPSNYLLAAYKKVCSIHSKMPKGGVLVFVTSQKDVKWLCHKLRKKSMLHCLGLYAMLPIEKQQLVFKEPPQDTRLCVIATNVAETSITIPNIKYVVDTGLEKKKIYDVLTSLSSFVTTWTSKSSAEQRTGRAGRMGPGFCFRLYSSAVFTNDLADHAEPQILLKPVEDLLLQMKSMNIDNVVNFPFPTRPSMESLVAAEKKLILLGALDDSKFKKARYQDISKTEYASRPTALGKAMANFAVSARCSKMIILAPAKLISHVVCLVSALTVREIFLEGNQWRELRKKWVGHGNHKLLGDFMLMLKAVSVSETIQCSNGPCLENGLRTKAVLEIDKLRKQLVHEINNNPEYPSTDKDKNLKRPTESQCKVLRQLLLSSFCDHVARKLPDGEIVDKKTNDPDKPAKKKLKNAYECMEADEPVYIAPDSVLRGEHPEYIIYKELYKGDKMFMRDVAVIEPEWLPFYAEKLCNFSEASSNSNFHPPKYDKLSDQIVCVRPTTYGPLNWHLGNVEVPMHLTETGIEIFKHFACFLLAGDVFDWFKKYSDKLLSSPSIMTKAWSKLQPRTSKILKALVSENVKNKKDLVNVWQKDPTYLQREYLAWLPESTHSKVIQDWQQLVSAQ